VSRGVLYVYWGDAHGKLQERSVESLRRHHPELPVHVERLPDGATLLDKASMFDMSPFEETLYLDTDTVVVGRLDFAFDKAALHGIACAICECPWARRYQGLTGDLIEYNTGVLFFTRKAAPLFEAWEAWAQKVDSTSYHLVDGEVRVMPVNDQAAFAVAVEETGYVPFVLPLNWNFRPQWHLSHFGPIRIWHDAGDMPPELGVFSAEQDSPEAVIRYVSLAGVFDVKRQG
jgi:hypothetical protein